MEIIIWWWVDVAPFMHYFKDHDIKYIWVYNASEGYFWYQDIISYDNINWNAPYKLLTNHWIFYEFLEFSSNNFDENWNVRNITKAKAIVILTDKVIFAGFLLLSET